MAVSQRRDHAPSDRRDQRDAAGYRAHRCGDVQIRLFANVGKSIKVATSATITVVAATPASVTVSPTTVNPSGAITVTVANGAGYAGDWIGLFTTGAPDSTYLAWQFLNGTTTQPATGKTSATLQVVAPTAAGTYNVRLFANNGESIRVATSGTITVVAGRTQRDGVDRRQSIPAARSR